MQPNSGSNERVRGVQIPAGVVYVTESALALLVRVDHTIPIGLIHNVEST